MDAWDFATIVAFLLFVYGMYQLMIEYALRDRRIEKHGE